MLQSISKRAQLCAETPKYLQAVRSVLPLVPPTWKPARAKLKGGEGMVHKSWKSANAFRLPPSSCGALSGRLNEKGGSTIHWDAAAWPCAAPPCPDHRLVRKWLRLIEVVNIFVSIMTVMRGKQRLGGLRWRLSCLPHFDCAFLDISQA